MASVHDPDLAMDTANLQSTGDGEIRGDTTEEIARWFIDTDYNEESFFVRHAYFTGADEPSQKLQRALKAEIDEAGWSRPYSTVNRPFDPPSTGKMP